MTQSEQKEILYFLQNDRFAYKKIHLIKGDLEETLDKLTPNKTIGSYRDTIFAITKIDLDNPNMTDFEKKLCKDIKEYIFIIRGRGLYQVGNMPYIGKWDIAIYYCIFSELISPKYYDRTHLLKEIPNNPLKIESSTQTETATIKEVATQMENIEI
jgi:hypothetical protein